MTLNKHFLLTLSYFTMDISSTKWSGVPLIDNEKLMVINVYNYFSGANSKKEDHQKVTLRKHVVEVLDIGECTVARVVSDWKSRGNNTFTPHKNPWTT